MLSPKINLPDWRAIPISATLVCTPIIIAISGTLSIISIPANIVAAPLVAPITVLGFIVALVPITAPLLIPIISPFAKSLAFIAHQGSHFPTLSLPKSFLGAGLVVGVILAIYKLRFFSLIFLSPLIFIFIIQNNQFPGKNWEVTNCNVGQGDGLVLNLGQGQAILIDVGPDEKKIEIGRAHV